jgi:hypothetical protein
VFFKTVVASNLAICPKHNKTIMNAILGRSLANEAVLEDLFEETLQSLVEKTHSRLNSFSPVFLDGLNTLPAIASGNPPARNIVPLCSGRMNELPRRERLKK